jgi:hypothetical protein
MIVGMRKTRVILGWLCRGEGGGLKLGSDRGDCLGEGMD